MAGKDCGQIPQAHQVTPLIAPRDSASGSYEKWQYQEVEASVLHWKCGEKSNCQEPKWLDGHHDWQVSILQIE
ncbi:unnamed protein product [Aphanomyces euteiches]